MKFLRIKLNFRGASKITEILVLKILGYTVCKGRMEIRKIPNVHCKKYKWSLSIMDTLGPAIIYSNIEVFLFQRLKMYW